MSFIDTATVRSLPLHMVYDCYVVEDTYSGAILACFDSLGDAYGYAQANRASANRISHSDGTVVWVPGVDLAWSLELAPTVPFHH